MAKFIMRRNNVRLRQGDDRLYPQIVLEGVATLDDIAQRISNATTFNVSDIKGVVSALSYEIAAAAANGKSVRINGLGTFRARLQLAQNKKQEHAADDTRRNTVSVCVGGIYYKPSKELVAQTNELAKPQRVKQVGYIFAEAMSREERLQALRGYLNDNPFITCPTYATLTRQSRSAATKELRALADDETSFIAAEGRGSHRIYVLKN